MSVDFSDCSNSKIIYKGEQLKFSYPEYDGDATMKTIARFPFINRCRPQNSNLYFKRSIKITKYSNYRLFYGWMKGNSKLRNNIKVIIYKSNSQGRRNPEDENDDGIIYAVSLREITKFTKDDVYSHVFPIPDDYTGPVSLMVKVEQFTNPPSKRVLESTSNEANIKTITLEEM